MVYKVFRRIIHGLFKLFPADTDRIWYAGEAVGRGRLPRMKKEPEKKEVL